MADIFQEVQEDLRRERAKALWDRYGTLMIVLAALVVLGVGGWRGYQYYEAQAAATTGDRYAEATRLAADGKADDAREAFAAIAADAPGGYRTLARLREADELAKTDATAALKLYQEIVASGGGDAMLRDAARVRGAYVAVDAGSRDDVRKLAEPLVTPDGAWSMLAREALGLAAYKAQDMIDARRHFETIVSDPNAPGTTRQRADLMLAVLPPPAPEKPAK